MLLVSVKSVVKNEANFSVGWEIAAGSMLISRQTFKDFPDLFGVEAVRI